MSRRLVATALWLAGTALAPALPAAAPDPSAPAGNIRESASPRHLFARIRGLFDVDLPELDPPGTVKLTFRPHFGDFLRRDYVRVASGARWTLTDRLELNAEAEAFATHGFRGTGPGYGIGEVRLGGKYVFREWLHPELEAGVSLEVQIPTGRPPPDLTDGFNHFTPTFTVQHHSAARPRLTLFASASLDFLTDSSVPGTLVRNQPRDDSLALTAGAVYDLGQFKWTVQTTYANTWIGGEDDHFFTIRPSVLWFVPRKLTFNSNTQWIVGLGARSTWGPDGHEIASSSRVRAEVTFRQVMDRIRFQHSK